VVGNSQTRKLSNMRYDRKIRHLIVLVTIFFFQMGNSFAQSEKIKQIDSLMKWANKIVIFNGNILVSKNGKVIYQSSFGFVDASKRCNLNQNYRFNIGSITKEFSAVSIMKLKEQGRLKLEDKVSKFIPELPKWANSVSIKDLLQYSSGLPDINWDKVKNDKDIFNDLKHLDTLRFNPGSNYYYNNNNVLLRQFVVERITKMPFNSYVDKYIFKPCSMNSAIMNPLGNTKNIAKSYNNDFVEDPTDLPISGIAYVTTLDLLKWTKSLHSGKVINKHSIYEVGQAFNLPGTQSGLGNAVFDDKNLKEHQHDGQSRNFEALMFSNLKDTLTIILVGNNVNEKVFEISEAIRAILKDESYNLPKKSFFTQYRKQLDSLKIEDFIILYHSIRSSQKEIYDVENEGVLNRIGYQLMNNQRLDDCITIFKLNIQQFPISANVYDSMGEAYYIKGELKLAALNYKKSLELDPKNDNARQMIEKIENGK
jgi:CubicO group peptidase (beta-lactamase class C family)